MNHEVGRVSFYDGRCCGCANYMGLLKRSRLMLAIFISLESSVRGELCWLIAGWTNHISAQPGRCHCRKVRCAGVIFTASNNCNSSHLTCILIRKGREERTAHGGPLWNFSSMGGTIFLTFIRISFVVCDILYFFLVV